jgi:hypothetical protein
MTYPSLEYYSEVEDTDIPTVDLGVPNTERGKSLSVVKVTWGNTTSHIEYYNEVEDTDIPTVDLGVPNTERGKSLSDVYESLIGIKGLSSSNGSYGSVFTCIQ